LSGVGQKEEKSAPLFVSMLNVSREIDLVRRPQSLPDSALPLRPRRRPRAPYDYNVKSATRALEIIELFAIHRQPLTVTEISSALSIPQSSSSVLLHSLSSAGFITRDRKTRKYIPSARSVFLGNWIHDALFPDGSLLAALDELSHAAQATVRLGVRNSVYVRYVHVSWPRKNCEKKGLSPGLAMPICQDALGRALLMEESDRDICGIIRRVNAEADGASVVKVETFMEELRAHRGAGFVECDDLGSERERVLAVQLRPLVGEPLAIGLGLDSSRLPGERDRLLQLLVGMAKKIEGDGLSASIDQCDLVDA
jgi:IclR family transcriptional regulator, acetate operon repressor